MIVFHHPLQNHFPSQHQKPTTMTTVAASPPHPNPQSRLELLSNTALLKKVMDSKVTTWQEKKQQEPSVGHQKIEEPKKSTMETAVTPTKSAVVDVPTTPSTQQTSGGVTPTQETEAMLTKGDPVEHHPKIQSPVAEKFSSSPPKTSTSVSAYSTPTTVSPTPPVIMDSRMATFATSVPSSYGSLLLPVAPSTALNHHQLLAWAAQAQNPSLPQNIKTAMAACMMNAASTGQGNNKVYGGGPSSAFQKPYSGLLIPKENAPPAVSASASASSPTMEDSRQSSPTQTPGEASSREGLASPPSTTAYEALIKENLRLQQQLRQKNDVIATLQTKADGLEKQIGELRQLPTGKISHIPIEDMIRIMQEYGSEVSNQTLPKRKQPIQKASIVRQFRRWNPEFFRYFVHVNGEWVPRLGKEGELKRRVEKRRSIQKNKRVGSPDSAKSL